MSRPEILFPLFADLETLEGVGPKTAKRLCGRWGQRPKDLLFLLPAFGDRPAAAVGPRGVAADHRDGRGDGGRPFPAPAQGRPYR
jgi:ATP-dependent DNA helicase RecG